MMRTMMRRPMLIPLKGSRLRRDPVLMVQNQYQFEKVTEYYNSEGIYERYVQDATKGLTDKERQAIGQYFAVDGGMVLDLGCGTGRTTAVLDEMGFDVIGADLTESYLEVAREVTSDVEFCVSEAMSLPFDDETFDYVLFSYNGIDHIIPEGKRYMTLLEIRRVLKPEGIFLFSTHNFWSLVGFNPLNTQQILRTLAFWLVNIHPRWLLTRYKMDNAVQQGPLPNYYIRPTAQRRQLKACGFEVIETVGTNRSLRQKFHRWHYYVARKIRNGR
ncbi:class I SAM-dependent methyltransferase [Natrinema amylolyticum]|uniref:class I SAM-dependent methyltransferase n=1 Tax=Natrinema amylolyticum TaxID=2878679 RepID=UPI001CF95B93|nr:class I SAM-dependent methyltransferase [Natrinema amylolyticum]